jgi:hypothetical protein
MEFAAVDAKSAMKWALALVLAACFGNAASAENCSKSLDYILNDFAGELSQPAMAYRSLLGACLQTLTMTNVQDAYLLADGGIAVIPKSDSITATAGTLAEFCEKYPRGALRFITKREVRKGLTTGLVVMMSSTGSESCKAIRGEQ